MREIGSEASIHVTALTIALCCTVLSGCIPVPYVTGHIPPSEYNRNIDEQTSFSLEIGKTTRKEVLLKLGEPDKMDGENSFIYEAASTKGAELWNLFVPICGGSACFAFDAPIGSGAEYQGYRLIIDFDEQGIVKERRFETFKREDKRSEKLERVF